MNVQLFVVGVLLVILGVQQKVSRRDIPEQDAEIASNTRIRTFLWPIWVLAGLFAMMMSFA